ncbi:MULTISPECIES: NADH-dependent flavin oxidoreductase [Paenibacillus]|jgi:2,4-dienoyl-CoA reductase-like NADH-dependent reductase (Old Yellow Enzyme family)|uniref:NADH-dependent flavin oxidoreductase n=1 Tax=Paenibacillus TaxID=44249 RepID=UPI0004F87517|nr:MULTISPECIES: NADH-dependent flavin oxidoreductase [unclassified Paenibacillus]AIQ29975.1 NADH:flavin oxidoreductase [Paenibacillus sp. FSL P4-0081]OMF25044.1 NADH:flavin oxidoreductase [Paenibacillus sp. FSL H8-0259]
MNTKYNSLFESFTFKNGISLRNRVVMSPMTTWASNDDYTISDGEVNYYRRRVTGVGLVITGCTHVQPNGIGFTNEFAAYDDKFIPSLRRLADAAKSGGAAAVLQIFHAGSKALPDLTPNRDVVSSSAVETEATGFAPSVMPRELSHDEVWEVIHAFGETTRRAIEAGFDGVEIHGAHGFLVQNFFSPYFNRREDDWGGSLENRLRFPLAIVKEMKRVIEKHAVKPFILGYRISPDEHQEGGIRMKDTYVLIDRLIEAEVDYVHASLADALSSKPVDSQDDRTYLELIVEHVNSRISLLAAGSMVTPDDAAKGLDKGLNLAVIGHALITDPDWIDKVQSGQESDIQTAIKASNINTIDLPEKLWAVLQASGPWFKIEN